MDFRFNGPQNLNRHISSNGISVCCWIALSGKALALKMLKPWNSNKHKILLKSIRKYQVYYYILYHKIITEELSGAWREAGIEADVMY